MLPNSPTRLALYTLAALALIAAVIFFGLRKTVTLTVDGRSRQLTTYKFNVSSLLHSQGVPLSSQDTLTPSSETWLHQGEQVTLTHAIPVLMDIGGELLPLYTADRNPTGILKQARISLESHDQLLSNGRVIEPSQPFPADATAISLQLIRAKHYTLTVDGQQKALASTQPTLGSALWEAGYTLHMADRLTPSAATPLTSSLSATLLPSRQVTISTAGGVHLIRTSAATVGEALGDAGFPLQELDYSLPSAEQPVPASGVIRLVRVTEVVAIEQSPLKFETQYQPDDQVEIDTQSVIQAGEYGLNAQRVRTRYEDGQQVSQQVESQWTARQPVPRILGYGTMLVMHTAVVDGTEIQYWRTLTMYATSYHPSEGGDVTASGLPLKKGVAAIDRSLISFYTQMYIPGYGEAIAADTGGGVIGRWIDLGYSDSDYVPWHQWVTVYFLWPPPESIVWIIP